MSSPLSLYCPQAPTQPTAAPATTSPGVPHRAQLSGIRVSNEEPAKVPEAALLEARGLVVSPPQWPPSCTFATRVSTGSREATIVTPTAR